MILPATLTGYFARQFAFWIFGILVAITAVVFLFDLIELLRRGSGKDGATFGILFEMALLKIPKMTQIILPFAVLVGSMMAITRLTRSQELAVTRSAGLSIWQFLFPVLVLVLCLGVFRVAVFNPVSSVLTEKFEMLENRVLRNRASALAVSSTGIWLRERTSTGYAVLHARNIMNDSAELLGLTVFLFRDDDKFISRIDAPRATLESGYWKIDEATAVAEDGILTRHTDYRLETALTVEDIEGSFLSPDTMSFWDLPDFIDVLEGAGFSAVRHRLHLHELLASPLLLCSMVMIAATFSVRRARRSGTLVFALIGLFFGFFLYLMSDVVFALGLSSRIPEVLAAWTPATVTTLLGVAGLLHMEDG